MKQTVLGIILLSTVAVACGRESGDANAYITEIIPVLTAQAGMAKDYSRRFESAENGRSVVTIFSQYMASNQVLGKLASTIQDRYKAVSREAFMSAYSNRHAEMTNVETRSEQANMRLQVAFFSNRHRDSQEVRSLISDLSNQAAARFQDQGDPR